jgi:hypothetical protein
VRSLPEILLIDLDDTILRYGAGGAGLWSEVAERFAARLPVPPVRLLAALEAAREPFWRDPERSRAGRQDMFAARRAIFRPSLRAAWAFGGKRTRSRTRGRLLQRARGARRTVSRRARGARRAAPARPSAGSPMIGDDLDADVAGASAAGLAAVWVDHAGAGPPHGGPRPARVVRALAERVAPD